MVIVLNLLTLIFKNLEQFNSLTSKNEADLVVCRIAFSIEHCELSFTITINPALVTRGAWKSQRSIFVIQKY